MVSFIFSRIQNCIFFFFFFSLLVIPISSMRLELTTPTSRVTHTHHRPSQPGVPCLPFLRMLFGEAYHRLLHLQRLRLIAYIVQVERRQNQHPLSISPSVSASNANWSRPSLFQLAPNVLLGSWECCFYDFVLEVFQFPCENKVLDSIGHITDLICIVPKPFVYGDRLEDVTGFVVSSSTMSGLGKKLNSRLLVNSFSFSVWSTENMLFSFN